MLRPGAFLLVGFSVALAASCGGAPFSAATGGGDASSPQDGGGNGDVVAPDSPSTTDALEEAPARCTGAYQCVVQAPSGWTGPVEVYAGATAPQACTSGFAGPTDAFDMLTAPDATCGCTCGAEPVTCDPPTLDFAVAATCATTGTCASVVLQPGVCTTVDQRSHCGSSVVPLALTPTQPSPTMGSCPPQATTQVPPLGWGVKARACGSNVTPSQADCAAAHVCAPKSAPPYAAKLCVTHDGDVACPGAYYSVKHVFYQDADDTRGCEACTCSGPTGGSCDFSVASYASTDQSCTGGATTYGRGVTCAGVNQPSDFKVTVTTTQGSCAPSMPSATGSATPASPVTVCCPL